MTTLYSWRTEQSSPLTEVLESCKSYLVDGIGLVYSPNSCEFVRLEAGELKNYSGETIDYSTIFEARIFNETAELRWLNQNEGHGIGVILSESVLESPLPKQIDILDELEANENQYLLWGKGINSKGEENGAWGTLVAARIGGLAVPISGIEQDRRVFLKAREYLKAVDNFGNFGVVEERLLGLDVKS